ncbi:MAG: hypothetical protein IIY88_03140, partial [Eubacterium sp.]|nr:hypothetical protein [Eubacterium sp.]
MIIKDETEKTIIGIIENTCRGDYDSAIRSIWDPGVFFHLSSLREGLVRWMPLRQGSCVLEIGGGFGALTGAILSMCGSVDVTEPDVTLADAIRTRYKDCENLRVTADVPVKRYDYIFLMDADEKIAGRETETLGMYRRMLSDNGVLIVGFRNRFGVKYWCGGTDDKVTEPFTAITGSCSSGEEPGCRLYSKREIEAFAKQAGFGKGLFYYPMPNEFFPQAIVSDEEPPTESIADRVFPVDPFDSPVIVGEREILPELIRGGLLTELADYVIAVFKRDGTVPKRRPVYAALSMDRGKERGFATVIFSDDTVRKKALFPEGMPVLEVLQRNAEELSKRNVRTVLHKLEDGEIVMPRVREQSMLSYIESAQKPDDVRGVFRALWENILKSSEAADMADESNDIRGPILRTGYIDMIPYNCFMTGDGPLYYDQEFMVENCPAGYIMFRAIKYTYIHLPELERLIPQAELRKDYGLTDELWKTYEDQEKEFVKENRRSELFPQVYRWSWRNNAGIDERRRLIAGGSAEAADAVLLKKVHDVQFGILKEIDRVCKELGLRYFAIHGTLLGAVRDGK